MLMRVWRGLLAVTIATTTAATTTASVTAAGAMTVGVSTLATLSGTGCFFQNISAEELLRDAVTLFNDDLRWMRIRAAGSFVTPSTRSAFLTAYGRWGEEIHIVDMEILGVEYDKEKGRASVRVAFGWTEQASTIMRSTEIEESWKKDGRSFLYIKGKVVKGHEGLLEP